MTEDTTSDVKSEQTLLGMLFLEPTAMGEALSLGLLPEHFDRMAHADIFGLLRALYEEGKPADLPLVAQEARQRGLLESIGGAGYLAGLLDSVPSAAGLPGYVRHLQALARTRAARDAARRTAEFAERAQDAEGILAYAQNEFGGVGAGDCRSEVKPIGSILRDLCDDAEEMALSGQRWLGVPTGFGALDAKLGNMQRGDLVTLAGRPGTGKTSLGLLIAMNVALGRGQGGTPQTALVFSLEMSQRQLGLRIACSESGLNSQRVRCGDLDENEWGRLHKTLVQLYEIPLLINDNVGPNILEIAARARQTKERGGLGLVVVDYLQLIDAGADAQNRTQVIDKVSRELKRMALALDVPILALAQLSRAVEHRESKRPVLSDLRESGSVEANSDVVLLLYREGYYGRKPPPPNPLPRFTGEGEKEDTEAQEVEVIVAKHRNGPTGTVMLGFIPAFTRFVSLARRKV